MDLIVSFRKGKCNKFNNKVITVFLSQQSVPILLAHPAAPVDSSLTTAITLCSREKAVVAMIPTKANHQHYDIQL